MSKNQRFILLGDNFPKRVKTPGKGQPPKNMIKSVFYQIISPAESKSLERVSFQRKNSLSINKISSVESKPTKTVSLNLGFHTRHQTIKLPCQESASTLGIVQGR